MSRKRKIRWLQRYKRAYERVFDLECQLHSDHELKASIFSETHIINNTNALDEVLIRQENLEEEYKTACEEMLEIKREIESALTSIEDSKAVRVLHLRYIELCKWADIEKRMNYSEASVFRLHSLGLDTLKLT